MKQDKEAITEILSAIAQAQLALSEAERAFQEMALGIDIATIHVGVRAAGKRPDSMWVISYDDLADLAEYATKTQCMACNQMHKPCRLREILKDLPIDGVEKLVVGCWED